ncbi:MAG: hypothetical protein Fues2KO_21300 [Fuerstiella sp.]
MSDTSSYTIRPAGRHLLTIGRDLIQGHAAAVAELVKNAYDADATEVKVELAITEGELTSTVSDNGHGMSRDTVINSWLVPSTTDKLVRKHSPRHRAMQGRKGVGRYAASMLGDDLLLETVHGGEKTVVYLDWCDFESSQYLDDVEVLVETTPTEEENGTTLTIKGSQSHVAEWTPKAFQKLRFELRKLIPPTQLGVSSGSDDNFQISLRTEAFPDEAPESTYEVISPFPLFELFDYRIHGTVSADGQGVLIFQNQRSHSATKEEVQFHTSQTECGSLRFDICVFDREGEAIGQLVERGRARADDFVGKLEAKRLLNENNGIGVYRNGFRIRPLGDPDFDWVQLNRRRVQKPTVHLGSNQVIGYVLIESEERSGLEEKSARDGLRENAAYKRLQEITLLVLKELESRRFAYRTKTGPRQGSGAIERKLQSLFEFDRLRNQIEEQLRDSHIAAVPRQKIMDSIAAEEVRKGRLYEEIRRAIAIYQGQATLGKIVNVVLHEGRRPLSVFKNEAPNLKYWSSKISAESRSTALENVQGISDRLSESANSLVELFKRLDPLAAGKRGEPVEFDVVREICRAFDIFRHELDSEKIVYSVRRTGPVLMHGWPQDVVTIFANLIDNSIYWLVNDPTTIRREINVELSTDANGLRIDYRDSGPGIARHLLESQVIFEPEFSEKPGGMGLGLAIAGEAAKRNGLEMSALEAVRETKGAHFRLQSMSRNGAGNDA